MSDGKCSRGRRTRSLLGKSAAAVYDRRQFCDASCSALTDRLYSRPPGPKGSASKAAATTSTCWTRWLCLIASASIIALFIVSCANFAPAPEISPALVANARLDRADAQTLSQGRALFVSRCLECHTLPSVTKHSPNQWPHLVSRMSGRANLTASEKEAITAYLRAASLTTVPTH